MTQHVTDQLAIYRSLTPEERHPVDAHLTGCAECRATLAAYHGQDEALAAIRDIRPRRALTPDRSRLPRHWVTRLGDGLALAGLAALIWFFALQVQLQAQGGAPQPAALQPGITLPPTTLRPPTPWLGALPGLAAALLGTGGLFIFTRRSRALTLIGAIVAASLLTGFVPPFSSLPNPIGFYWLAVGGYTYDPRLPFKNNFVIAGDPASVLKPRLEALIDETGLTPLDPNQPLQSYEILQVGVHPTHDRVVLVTTRFIYADGSSRVYPVPLFRPEIFLGRAWLAGWRADGLERLRSEHLAFPGQPFATNTSPIQLGAVQQISLHPEANRLDEANPGHWLWESVRVERLVVAPDASAFLMTVEMDNGLRQLWLAPLDGSAPTAVFSARDIRAYGFSPDSRFIVFTHFDPDASAVDSSRPYAVSVTSVSKTSPVTQLVTGLASDQLPGLTAEGLWFISEGNLWRMPYTGEADTAALVRQNVREVFALAPRPSPDGARVALACSANAICLSEVSGGNEIRVEGVAAAAMEWSPDGSALAVVDRDPNNFRPVYLWVVARDGTVRLKVNVAPRDVTDPPQWTPDSRAIFVATFPQDGRRIIAVDLPSGQVLDLSQEHWDTYFALMPDGKHMLLNNGRGDFWRVAVVGR